MRTRLMTSSVAVLLIAGCQAPAFYPRDLGAATAAIAAHVLDQGVLDKYLANLSAQGIDPGLATEVSVKWGGKVYVDGVAANASLGAIGSGNQQGPSAQLRDLLMDLFEQDPTAVEQVITIIETLRKPPDPDVPTPPE